MEKKNFFLKAGIAIICIIWVCLIGLCGFSLYFWYYRASLRPDNPPPTFRESDLVGTWKADYRHYDWGRCDGPDLTSIQQKRRARSLEEWLILRKNQTFYQVLQDRKGQFPEQWAQGTWWVERLPDGVTRLHLRKGIFFANEICYHFPKEPTISGWISYFADQTGHELNFKQEEESILIVGWDKFARKLYLEYPFVGNPDAPIIVKFERIPEAGSVPVPTVEP